MSNIFLDLNIIFDNYNEDRIRRFPTSVEIFQLLKNSHKHQLYISSSSLDNLKFVKMSELQRKSKLHKARSDEIIE